LEHRGEFARRVQVPRGGEADAAGDRSGEVGEDVSEEVVGDDDVESAGVFDHVDRRRVDVHVVYGDVGVRRADLRHDAGPELARVDHDVRLVHEGQLAAATGREFERVLDDAAHAVGGVDAEL